MGHDAFRAGVEAQSLEAMVDALSPDVVFHSPITFKPFEGKDAVSTLLGVVMATFEDFRYTDELDSGGVKALVFEARVGDKQVQGLDLLRFDDEGLIEDFTVMVRPLSAAMALAEAVGKGLERAAGRGPLQAAGAAQALGARSSGGGGRRGRRWWGSRTPTAADRGVTACRG